MHTHTQTHMDTHTFPFQPKEFPTCQMRQHFSSIEPYPHHDSKSAGSEMNEIVPMKFRWYCLKGMTLMFRLFKEILKINNWDQNIIF